MMCWRRPRRWDVRRSMWRALWSATPRLSSRNPRSERANVALRCGIPVHRTLGPAGGTAAAASPEPLGGAEMRLEAERPSGKPGRPVSEECDDRQIRRSEEKGSERRAAAADAGADDGGSGQEP